ncbi:MAG: twitching motility protein PilT [Christensenellales bacterium]
MVQLIYGKKGSGKTKTIISMANNCLESCHGSIVFIDDDNRYMYDLKNRIRFINATEYSIDNPCEFHGFLCGLMAGDFDLEKVFIDGFMRIIKCDIKETEEFFTRLVKISDEHNVSFVFSVSGEQDDAPEFLKPFIIN